MAYGPKPQPLHVRLMNRVKVNPETGCWEWTGFRKPNGYAQFGRNKYAHRVSYGLYVGIIPDGMGLDHLCRNKGCVNPEHLEPVTQGENVRRAAKTHCKHGHPLFGDNLKLTAKGYRECRICIERRWRAQAERRKAAA